MNGARGGIGTLAESSLHAALVAWYAQPGDALEAVVSGYVIDIKREDLLIEVQTGNFAGLRCKLAQLLPRHQVRVLYPLPVAKWIVRTSAEGEVLARRKSPKRARVEDVFRELVSLPELLSHSHLAIEIVWVEMEEVWRQDGRGSWRRRGWSIADRRLLAVQGSQRLQAPADYLALLPATLPDPFSNRDLAQRLGCPLPLAGKMTYTLRQAGWLALAGKRGKALVFTPPAGEGGAR